MEEPDIVEIPEFDWMEYVKEMKEAENLSNKDGEAPKNEPFVFRYEARKIYEKYELIFSDMYERKMKESAEENEEESEENEDEDIEEGEKNPKLTEEVVRLELGKVLTILGVNYYLCEEVPGSQIRFEKALKLLSIPAQPSNLVVPGRPKVTLSPYHTQGIPDLCISLNYLGLIWYDRKTPEKSVWYLQMSEHFYNIYNLEKSETFEQTYTLTCYYLAQAYALQQQRNLSAQYSFRTLRRQWASKEPHSVTEWAINAAMLSSFFIENELFSIADHCLKCAMAAIRQEKKEGKTSKERIDEIEANVCILYSNFYKDKLAASKRHLEDELEKEKKKANVTSEKTKNTVAEALFSEMFRNEDNVEDDSRNPNRPKKLEGGDDEEENEGEEDRVELGTYLPRFNQDLPSRLIDSIPLKRQYVITELPDATFHFKLGKKFMDISLRFFILDGYVTDHIKILQSLCDLYSLLCYWEKSRKRRISIHKRRIALFLQIAEDLNANYYLDTKKQLYYTIGETYSTIVEELFEDLENVDKDKKAGLCQQLNEMGLKSIEYLRKFQDLFVSTENQQFTVEKINRPAVVSSMFTLASVYYKIEPTSPALKRKFLVLSLKEFRRINQFIKSEKFDEEEQETVKLESDLADEMEHLIPYKIREIDLTREKEKFKTKSIDFDYEK